ncbi:hypothetical protein VB715_11905 [Crocosphaera sp. UHCC 0190]|uniref:hypothetical protein n=1 Tax=Crocosphaera sp. UHCC 0190 TaxID=3110246 RepID=UPI002B21A422|nr:hypothetical protein [Crocosphaera sp. UHCC 0190]MEA5510470.1 hypothetical protein [Crocosphaera sp. UHCC 0190]
MLLAGWTIPVNNINNTTTNNYFIGKGDNGLTQCWAKVSANATDIIVQGDWGGNNTILSSEWSIGKYTEGQENRLYLCWYSGQINSMGCVYAEVARNWANTDYWVSWEDVGFNNVTDWNTTSSNSYPSQGTFDRFTTALKPYSTYSSNVGSRNASSYAQNGSLNAVDQLAVLVPMYFVEGLTSSLSYPTLTYQGDSIPSSLPIRGLYTRLMQMWKFAPKSFALLLSFVKRLLKPFYKRQGLF